MKKAGLPIQADAPDAALHIGCMRGRVTRARNRGFVSMRQLRHCIAETILHRHSVARNLRVAMQCNRQNGSTQPPGLSVPYSFLPLDRMVATRTRVHNSHRGGGLDTFACAFGELRRRKANLTGDNS